MAERTREPTPFQLPVRIRSRKASTDVPGLRAAVAERLAELPDLVMVEAADATVPRSVDIYLQVPTVSLSPLTPDTLLCRIHPDGIDVHGLSDRDRYRVLASGWGKLAREGVLLHMPRDVAELDVCSDILRHARNSLIQSSAQPSPMRTVAWAGKLPRFSRTTLQ
jgi:hypothetical protein